MVVYLSSTFAWHKCGTTWSSLFKEGRRSTAISAGVDDNTAYSFCTLPHICVCRVSQCGAKSLCASTCMQNSSFWCRLSCM